MKFLKNSTDKILIEKVQTKQEKNELNWYLFYGWNFVKGAEFF